MILKVEGQWMGTDGLTYDYFENVTNPRVFVASYIEIEKRVREIENGETLWYLRNDGRDEAQQKEIVVTSACPEPHYAFDEKTATVLISWADEGMHYVICNTKAYLMNDSGKTIERLI